MDPTQTWLAAINLRAQWRERLDVAMERLKNDLDLVARALTEQEITIYEQVIHELETYLKLDDPA
jgi:hypothetical protein